MELRTTEEKINELLTAYEEIRVSSIWQPEQQALLPPTPADLVPTNAKKGTSIHDRRAFVSSFGKAQDQLQSLSSKVEKFRKRLFEIDPVTEKPRYGPKSQGRVRLLVARNDFLCTQYTLDFPEQYASQSLKLENYKQEQLDSQEQRQEQRRKDFLKQEELRKKKEQEENDQGESSPEEPSPMVTLDDNQNPDGSLIITPNPDAVKNDATLALNPTEASPASRLFAKVQEDYLQEQHAKQREADSIEKARLQAEKERKRKIAEEEARLKAQKAQEAAQKAAQEEAQRQQLHQQAEEARLRRRAQEEARKQAEREWLEGIQKGAEGVKHYLGVLLQISQEDKKEIDPEKLVALQSLCTLFEQIQKHPEEVNKRKIKLSNPNFHRDIGKHEGGIELLVAAGFRPTMLPAWDNANGGEAKDDNDEEEQPDIAFLISKEPNLEHDMDGWMAWFDLNKATLEILQAELQKVQGSKRSRR